MGKGSDTVEVYGGGSWWNTTWNTIDISTGKGVDQVLVAVDAFNLRIDTGIGSDLVTLRDCGDGFGYMAVGIRTGAGDDRVSLSGTNSFAVLSVQLDEGNDVLAGDTAPGSSLMYGSLYLDGFSGYDRLLNADYFDLSAPSELYVSGFEEFN